MPRKKIFGSIRGKIFSWTFGPTAIILAVVALISFLAYQQVAEIIAIERDQYFTDLSALQLSNTLIEQYQNLLNEYTGVLAHSFTEIKDPDELEASVKMMLLVARGRLEIFDGGVLVLNNSGEVVATTQERYETLGENWADRDYFRQMLRSPEPLFTEIVPDGLRNSNVVVHAIPITGDQGQFLGLIAGMLQVRSATTSSIANIIFEIFEDSQRRPYLVDGNGVVIYHYNTGEVWQNYASQPIVQQVLAGNTGAEVVEIPGKGNFLVGYAPVPGTHWGMVSETNWDVLERAIQRFGFVFLFLLIIGMIIHGGIVTFIVRQITQPVIQLSQATQKVAQGQFGEALEVNTGDEIEDLANNFNQMSGQLEESYEVLEKRIEAATQEVRHRADELSVLNEVGRELASTLDLDTLLPTIAERVSEALDADRCSVFLYDETEDVLVARAAFGYQAERFVGLVYDPGQEILGKAFTSGKLQYAPDLDELPSLPRRDEIRAVLSVPVVSQKVGSLGVISVVSLRPDSFGANQQQTLETMAGIIARAIENARLFSQSQIQAEELATLYNVSQAINASQSLEAMLQTIVDEVIEALPADRATLILMDVKNKQVPWFVKAGPGLEDVIEVSFDELWSGLSGWALRERQPAVSSKEEPDPRESPEVQKRRADTNCGAIVVVPLFYRGRPMGTLTAINRPDQPDFAPDAVEMLSALANQAAIAIRNARLYEETAQRAQELAILNAFSRKLALTLSLDDVLKEAYHSASQLMQISTFYISLYDEVKDELWTALKVVDGEFQAPHTDQRGGLTDHILATKEPLLFPENVQEHVQKMNIEAVPLIPGKVSESWVGVPIVLSDLVIGTMVALSYTTPRAFEQRQCDLLTAIANQTAIAIQNAQLYEKAQQEIDDRILAEKKLSRRVNQLDTLNRAGRNIVAILEQSELLQDIVDTVRNDLGYLRSAILMLDEEVQELFVAAATENFWPVIPEGYRQPKGKGAIGLAAESMETVLVSEASIDERVYRVGDWFSPSSLSLPIRVGKNVIGVLEVEADATHAFDESDQATLEIMSAQAAIAIQNAQLYEASLTAAKTKSMFLANMSHEIRTPLNAILGYSQILERDSALTTDQRKSLNTIGRSGEHLLALINDVLEMSKIEAQQVVLSLETFDLPSLLLDIEMMFEVRAKAKGLLLSYEKIGEIPQYIFGDESKIRQVLINLLGNAIKFTEEGGIILRALVGEPELSTADNDHDTVQFIFEVEDTGIGIPESDFYKIFEAFEQSLNGERSGEGTGLGLSISREYARIMGGDVTVTSQIGVGSTFRFEMKAQISQRSDLAEKTFEKRVICIKPEQGEYRALVVDDRETNRDLLTKMISNIGFIVREATNGLEAVEAFQEWQPQLILMDLVMPEMDGREAAHVIRGQLSKDDVQPTIIAVTASVLSTEKDAIIAQGVDDFIRKPFREADLFEKIRLHLGVEYIYEEHDTTISSPETSENIYEQLKRSMRGLSPEILADLRSATEALDTEQLHKLIDQITGIDQNQLDQLRELVDKLDIDMIEDLLEGDKS